MTISKNTEAKALDDAAIVNMQKAIDLQPMVLESYINMVMILTLTGHSDRIQVYFDTMDRLGVLFRTEDTLKRMANSAIHARDYALTKVLYEQIAGINPGADNLVNLALAYAYLGENDKAIEMALKTKIFGGKYAAEADDFIKQVQAGTYKK